jgi:predicted lipoprotein with Yx(FWY)xxD motif
VAKPLVIAAIALTVALAGCGGDNSSEGSGGDPGVGAQSESAGGATTEQGRAERSEGATRPGSTGSGITVEVSESQFGRILFDGDDRAIYLFGKESSSRSECNGACAEAWPPLLTEGGLRAGGGARPGLLGTTQRTDGTTQVTYNGHPLYYYVNDPPGQVLCHNVEEFGGLWLVVDPAGNPVE